MVIKGYNYNYFILLNMYKSLILLFVLTLVSASDLSQYSLKYVFEIVRHGARAPIIDDTVRFGTNFMPGELTPTGMR